MNIQLEIVFQVLLSFVVGMLIGFDRERSGKVARMAYRIEMVED